MARRSLGTLGLLIALLGATGGAAPAPQTAPPAASLFKQYRSGDSAAVMAQVSALPEAAIDPIAREIRRRIGIWVREAGGTDRARLDAATFLVDFAFARFETDWLVIRDLVEIGCRLVDAIAMPNDAVLRWHLAALALVEGAADARFLVDMPRSTEVASFDHLAHSRAKFPSESRFRLAEVVVVGMGSADLAPPRDQAWYHDDELRGRPGIGRVEVAMRNDRRALLRDMIPLTTTAGIAAEAHLRAGHLAFQLNEDAEALRHLGAAAEGTDEPFVDYIAHLLTAMVHTRRGNRNLAEASLRRALEVVPFAQSAIELLSAELFLSGREGQAHDLLDGWFARRTRPVDPWRMFGYGDFRRLPDLVVELRGEVGK